MTARKADGFLTVEEANRELESFILARFPGIIARAHAGKGAMAIIDGDSICKLLLFIDADQLEPRGKTLQVATNGIYEVPFCEPPMDVRVFVEKHFQQMANA